VPGVVALWIALSEAHAARDPLYALVPGAEGEVRRLVDAQLRDPDTATFVAERADSAGLAGLCIVRVDRAPPIHAETRRAEITDLYVEDARRRRGVGSALVERAYAWARQRGAPRVEVRVAAHNEVGRAFWRAQGFGDFMDVLHRRL
jgi:GNAT superfamily N-acetyltransferase